MPRLARGAAVVALAIASLTASPAAAQGDPRLTFEAARVDADPSLRTVDLTGRVLLRIGRYQLRGERLHLQQRDGSITFDGDARLALCPCPDPPITFAFQSGRFTPPGDLIVRFPRIALFGVPVFALPYLWLRGPDRIGALPPLVAWRGAEGLLIGTGVHLPIPGRDDALRALDLRASAYVQGGAAIGATLTAPEARARVVAEVIHGTRVAVDMSGALPVNERGGPTLVFDVDAIRGDRARRGTIALAEAALPFDGAAAALILRAAPGSASALVTTGLVGRAARGEGALILGPMGAASLGGALGPTGTWAADAQGMFLGNAIPGSALPLARAALHADLGLPRAPVRLRLAIGARASIAGDRPTRAPSIDAGIGARIGAELPLVRAFGAAPGEAPLVHWIAPALELGGALAHEEGRFFRPFTLLDSRRLALVEAGVSSALGRFAGSSIRLDLRVGALSRPAQTVALGEARLGAEAPLAAASLVAVAVAGLDGPGGALLAHLRAGPVLGPSLRLDLAGDAGADPRAARTLARWPSAVPSGEQALFAAPGWTIGAEGTLPLTRTVHAALGAVADPRARELLGLTARADYRHPCGCLALGLLGAHRLGRDGTDVIVTVALGGDAPRPPR